MEGRLPCAEAKACNISAAAICTAGGMLAATRDSETMLSTSAMTVRDLNSSVHECFTKGVASVL
jgi:hypothetical protein